MQFLGGNSSAELSGVSTVGVVDVWTALRPGDPGLTFNALDSELKKRIDYAFLKPGRGSNVYPATISTVPAGFRASQATTESVDDHGDAGETELPSPSSDHLGLVFTLIRPSHSY